MNKKAPSSYLCALKNELAKSLSILQQREILLKELREFADAVQEFARGEMNLSGECETVKLSSACLGAGLKTMGEIYEVHFKLPGISKVRLVVMTLSKDGVYPCSIRSDNAVELCRNLKEVRKALSGFCKKCCFLIVAYAGKARNSVGSLSENIASMGGMGRNPQDDGALHAKKKSSVEKRGKK